MGDRFNDGILAVCLRIGMALQIFAMCSCDSNLAVSGLGERNMSVTSLDKVVAQGGDEILITGKNLNSGLQAEINDTPVDIKITSQTQAILILPEDLKDGLAQVTFRTAKREIISLPLVIGNVSENIPFATIAADEICNDIIFQNSSGEMQRGERPCSFQECSLDGQSDCLATDEMPVARKENLAEKVVRGETVAGVEGTAENTLPECGPSQTPPCVVDGMVYKAAEAANLTPANIRDGVTIAGVAGTLLTSAPDCLSDGATGCITTVNFPAVDRVNVLQASAFPRIVRAMVLRIVWRSRVIQRLIAWARLQKFSQVKHWQVLSVRQQSAHRIVPQMAQPIASP